MDHKKALLTFGSSINCSGLSLICKVQRPCLQELLEKVVTVFEAGEILRQVCTIYLGIHGRNGFIFSMGRQISSVSMSLTSSEAAYSLEYVKGRCGIVSRFTHIIFV